MRNLENNISAVCVAADVIDVLVQNGQVARLTAGRSRICFANSVVYLWYPVSFWAGIQL